MICQIQQSLFTNYVESYVLSEENHYEEEVNILLTLHFRIQYIHILIKSLPGKPLQHFCWDLWILSSTSRKDPCNVREWIKTSHILNPLRTNSDVKDWCMWLYICDCIGIIKICDCIGIRKLTGCTLHLLQTLSERIPCNFGCFPRHLSSSLCNWSCPNPVW